MPSLFKNEYLDFYEYIMTSIIIRSNINTCKNSTFSSLKLYKSSVPITSSERQRKGEPEHNHTTSAQKKLSYNLISININKLRSENL